MVKTKEVETKKSLTMEELAVEVGDKLVPFGVGDSVECTVLQNGSHRVLCDVLGLTCGFVPEKEFSFDTKELAAGDKVVGSVMSMEGKDGMIVLSLRRADRDKLWDTLREKMEKQSTLNVRVASANRGGLMVDAGGLTGFLPVSQLSVDHYPRVEGGDSGQILYKLKRLVGEAVAVKIIAVDKAEEKLIFSEKEAVSDALGGVESLFEVGEVVEGVISGIAPFGLFINLRSIEGLIHISEVSWDHVSDLNKAFKVGQKVKAKVVKIENGKVSLSIKRLSDDPWIEHMKKLKVGQKVKGEVGKVTAYGAFVKLPEGLEGLVHIGATGGDPKKVKDLKPGEKKEFEVIELKPEARRIGLRLLDKS
ncbi:MAG: S1 RNA-binding domain-containing protein [bacterium]